MLEIVLEDGRTKRIGVTRAHLEEDAGKSLHEGLPGVTGIDLNRAGTPLIEIVSEPEMRSAKEAVAYMKKVHTLVRYLDICDGNMQEGSFRCDANVSVREHGAAAARHARRDQEPELVPLSSKRRSSTRSRGRSRCSSRAAGSCRRRVCTMPTRARRARCAPRRRRTIIAIFRIRICCRWCSTEAFIEAVRKSCPSCRMRRRCASCAQYGLSAYDAGVLTASASLRTTTRRSCASCRGEPKLAANWVMGELAAALNRDGLEIGASRISAAALAALLRRIADGTISGKIAKEVFEAMWARARARMPSSRRRGCGRSPTRGAIERVIDEVMAKNPGQLADYRAGKDKLFGFFVGQVMKATGGKANPAELNELLKAKLSG